VHNFGAKILLSDNIIDRIVACAQAGKLSSTTDLWRETKWKKEFVSKFSKALLAIVRIHCPINSPPKISTGVGPSTQVPSSVVRVVTLATTISQFKISFKCNNLISYTRGQPKLSKANRTMPSNI
jgi:hypothetical protein